MTCIKCCEIRERKTSRTIISTSSTTNMLLNDVSVCSARVEVGSMSLHSDSAWMFWALKASWHDVEWPRECVVCQSLGFRTASPHRESACWFLDIKSLDFEAEAKKTWRSTLLHWRSSL